MELVVAHYNENLDWLNQVNNQLSVKIYSRTLHNHPTLSVTFDAINKGNEALIYINYIIERYNTLPNVAFFIHAHETSWHHEGSMFNILNKCIPFVKTSCYYKNLNKNPTKCFLETFKDYNLYQSRINSIFDRPPILKHTLIDDCAQFIVTSDIIKRHPIEFYKKIQYYLLNTQDSNAISGRVLEYTWRWIWCDGPETPKPDKECIYVSNIIYTDESNVNNNNNTKNTRSRQSRQSRSRQSRHQSRSMSPGSRKFKNLVPKSGSQKRFNTQFIRSRSRSRSGSFRRIGTFSRTSRSIYNRRKRFITSFKHLK